MNMNSFADQISWIEKNFTEIHPGPQVALDLKYATTDNFAGENLYAGFHRCFLHPVAAKKFAHACEILARKHPDLQFRIWDALRPRSVQARMFAFLRGGPYQDYVAAPDPGSLHNYGMAIDLTLQKKSGETLEMGTDFDDFRDLAQPKFEEKFRASGELSEAALGHRLWLRGILEEAGFRVLPHEWWHFNALPAEQVHGFFPRLD
jgi:D-alanyl-D-alanine dipeptidase